MKRVLKPIISTILVAALLIGLWPIAGTTPTAEAGFIGTTIAIVAKAIGPAIAAGNAGVFCIFGHSWGSWRVQTSVSCTANGLERRTCNRSLCSSRQERSLISPGHLLTPWVAQNNSQETRWCRHSGCPHQEIRPTSGIQPNTSPSIASQGLLTNGDVGSWFAQQMEAVGTSPIAWNLIVGSLPPGLVLTSCGLLSGTLDMAGTYNFTVTATNQFGTNSRVFTITVSQPVIQPTIIAENNMVSSTVGTLINQPLEVVGTAPITWQLSAGSLPSGVTLSPGGVLSGMFDMAGTFHFTVSASNTAGSASQAFTTTVSQPVFPPTIVAENNMPSGTVGTWYSQQLTANGTTPMTWTHSAGALPPV